MERQAALEHFLSMTRHHRQLGDRKEMVYRFFIAAIAPVGMRGLCCFKSDWTACMAYASHRVSSRPCSLVRLGQLVEAVVDGVRRGQAAALRAQAAHQDVGLHDRLKGGVQLLGLSTQGHAQR